MKNILAGLSIVLITAILNVAYAKDAAPTKFVFADEKDESCAERYSSWRAFEFRVVQTAVMCFKDTYEFNKAINDSDKCLVSPYEKISDIKLGPQYVIERPVRVVSISVVNNINESNGSVNTSNSICAFIEQVPSKE